MGFKNVNEFLNYEIINTLGVAKGTDAYDLLMHKGLDAASVLNVDDLKDMLLEALLGFPDELLARK